MNCTPLVVLVVFLLATFSTSQSVDPSLTQHLGWRCIGPHRGGRTVGATGIPGRPNEFLIGVNNGGVWKTTDYGRTWSPIFDGQPTGSVGSVAVAPSSPDTIYVGSGEGLQRPDLSLGDGIYKSVDGGKTWTHLGLRDAAQISCLAVDPVDPDLVYAAVLGHPYGANETRGLYRTRDGGQSWGKILGPDADTGATQITIDPRNRRVLYCSLWAARQAPWENGRWQGSQSGLFKSVDGGDSWKRIEGGLPTATDGVGRIGIGVSATNSSRIFATVDSQKKGGIYRSNDAGETWQLVSDDPRLWTRGDDFAEIKVDPQDSNIVYCANTATYRSLDAGLTWTCWKGAPGGDDYHTIWIDPSNPKTVLLASDQGATLTVNGGDTWSSWYNQPTAQFYHVSTDNQFPYWVYGGQQESGSVGITSRGNDGQITFRDWHPVGVEEYGYVAVDPLDHNIVYGGKISKFDKRTRQVQEIRPAAREGESLRFLRTAPVLFSPVDPNLLYFAGNILFSTRDGGFSWERLSPDLSREHPDVPDSFRGALGGSPKQALAEPGRRGVIYAVGPSHFTKQTIWCGTDDGLVWITRDGGKNWKDITPHGLSSWSKISQIDAGHFDDDTAYIAVNRIRCDDQSPLIYVTHDGGATWNLRVAGLPTDPVNAVREDPIRRGLLYCATERMVHFSVDDGLHWTSLRLNMPCTSVRDLVVHKDDLVIGTHGRSFWILDNISSLRQMDLLASGHIATLFQPQAAVRVRWNLNTDTPLPPEEPGGKNPPDGAMIDFHLASKARSVKIEIVNFQGKVVRHATSEDQPFQPDPSKIPLPIYWLREPQRVPTEAGSHRWLWDMRFQPIGEAGGGVPMAAILHDTPAGRTGPWAPPGDYRVRLTVDGKSFEQPLTLTLDPRVTCSTDTLETLQNLTLVSYWNLVEIDQLARDVKETHLRIQRMLAANPPLSDADELSKIDRLLASFEQHTSDSKTPTLAELKAAFSEVLDSIESSEMPPPKPVLESFAATAMDYALVKAAWFEVKKSRFLKD